MDYYPQRTFRINNKIRIVIVPENESDETYATSCWKELEETKNKIIDGMYSDDITKEIYSRKMREILRYHITNKMENK